MGFRNGGYAKVWDIKPVSDTRTDLRISTSRKIKGTDDYEQDFSGFVSCYGTAVAKKAACLKKGDRIKLGEVDVTTYYKKETGTTYTNYKIFTFEVGDDTSGGETAQSNTEPQPTVDDGEVNEDRLPF